MEYFERLQKIAPIAKEPVKAAYRMHFTVSGANYHLFAARGEGPRIWRAKTDQLVEHAEHSHSYADRELHELYVNSLFTAKEVHATAHYFLDVHGTEGTVTPQKFPVPLPYSYGYLVFKDGQDDPDDFVVGNTDAKLPLSLLAYIHHAVGEQDEVWTESNFADDFTPQNRMEILTKSFVLEPGKDGQTLPFPLFCFAEPEGQCFLDQLRGVHDTILSQRESDEEAPMNKQKLTEACTDCVITDCRFKNSPDRYEVNCPADPTAHTYHTGARPNHDWQSRSDNHQGPI